MAERAYAAPGPASAPGRSNPPELRVVENERRLSFEEPRQSGREVAALVLVSILLHTGAAFGFLEQSKTPPAPRVSKVDIEWSKPAPPPPKAEPRPPAPPPPPPQAAPAQAKSVPASPEAPPPSAAPSVAAPESAPVDSGSSAEAAEDGNLFAGRGGSGVAPPSPRVVEAPAPPPAPKPIVAAHEGANYSKNPRPAYPARALREGFEGQVLVRVQVLPNGRPGTLKIQKSSGYSILDEAALGAIRGWSFVPARQGGEPVSGWVTVPIVFRLQ